MITILVNTPGKATLEFPEDRKLASECCLDVLEHIRVTQSPVIRTLSENVVNLMGHVIDSKIECAEKIDLWVEGEQYKFDDEGYIIDWRYGYFLWDERVDEKLKEMSPEKELT